MKTRNFSLLVAALTVSLCGAAPVEEHVQGRLLIQPREGARDSDVVGAMARVGARRERVLDRINVHILQVPETAIDQVSDALMKTGLFTYVEPDFVAHAGAISVTPNDPDYPSQWHLKSINAPTAWGITTGSSSVTIAVVDSGVDSSHPDLTSKLVAGWNFVNNTANTADDYGHGTAVAGTAAAATNNGVGIAGVSWNAMIMPLLVLDSTGSASYSNVASAIQYAADHGVRIINVSLGGTAVSSTLQSAINYAWNKGSVVFAAAMNNSSSTPYYPAACTYVVAVSATEPTGTLASFSNFGSYIDLAAPGDNILTTMQGGGYGTWYGTSFAAPIAASVGALALSVKPGISASALVSLLENNADPLGGYTGWNQYFGYGQVDAYRAVAAAGSTVTDTTPPAVSITNPASGATVSGIIQVQGTATDNVGVTAIQFFADGTVLSSATSSPFGFSWNTANYANGSHTLQVTASDAAGNVGTASLTLTVNNTTIKSTTPPTISILSPVSGANIAGNANNVTISASATDSVAVSQVSFYVDGILKCTDTVSPYTCAWNTKKASVGAHTIKATAWDSSGNSASVTETVYKQ
jgi:hypothetical protein